MSIGPRHTPPHALLVIPLTLLLFAACERHPVPGDGVPAPFVASRPDLVVTVSDARGEPVEGAWVVLEPGGRDAATDAAGEAHFLGVAGGDYAVGVAATGFAAARSTATIGDEDARLEVALVPARARETSLRGRVTTPRGAPIPGATVAIDGVVLATSDDDGRWEAEGVEGGIHELAIAPPPGSHLLPWVSPELRLAEGSRAEVTVALPGGPPAGARTVGSTVCVQCHVDVGARWAGSAHARTERTPAALERDGELPGLAAAFAEGRSVSLGGGATVTLARAGAGSWRARLGDATGAGTDWMPVVAVQGGHRTAAALVVTAGGTEAVLPAAWALAGSGLSSLQAPAALVPAWTEGWIDAGGRITVDGAGAPGAAASWASACGGCHAVGHELVEDAGRYALSPAPGALAVERAVGCEACHGPGGGHTTASTERLGTLLNPARLPSWQRLEVCARCHERTSAREHPFTDRPGWPVTALGEPLAPGVRVADHAVGDARHWLEAPSSRVHRDQAGELRSSPHHAGAEGYTGACEDCHDPHGSPNQASLRRPAADNALCTTCHVTRFPDEAAEAAHAGHRSFRPGTWSPGACVGCHMPRSGVAVRGDAVSGAGGSRSHALWFAAPRDSLAEFDAAGTTWLPRGAAPLPACLDCHLQADAAARDAGTRCPCPVGEPERRSTFEDLQGIWERWWGGGW